MTSVRSLGPILWKTVSQIVLLRLTPSLAHTHANKQKRLSLLRGSSIQNQAARATEMTPQSRQAASRAARSPNHSAAPIAGDGSQLVVVRLKKEGQSSVPGWQGQERPRRVPRLGAFGHVELPRGYARGDWGQRPAISGTLRRARAREGPAGQAHRKFQQNRKDPQTHSKVQELEATAD